jgi:hypothetical protein
MPQCKKIDVFAALSALLVSTASEVVPVDHEDCRFMTECIAFVRQVPSQIFLKGRPNSGKRRHGFSKVLGDAQGGGSVHAKPE